MVIVNQITEFTDLTEDNLPTLTTLDCHGNALTNVKNINIPTLRKLYLVSKCGCGWCNVIAVTGNQSDQHIRRVKSSQSVDNFTLERKSVEITRWVE